MSFDPFTCAASFAEILSAPDGHAQNLASSLSYLTKELKAIRAFLLRHVREKDGFTVLATAGFDARLFRTFEARMDSGVLQQIHMSAKPTILTETDDADSLSFLSENSPTWTLLTVPVVHGGQNVGLLGVQVPGRPSQAESDYLPLLAHIAAFIGQSLRVEHIIQSERRRLLEENTHLKQELKEKHEFSHIVGNSGPMKLVYDQVRQVARSNATVLLRGESGTGKEMIANAIHYNSLRSKRPLVKINCAALPETLIESELFGHEKGAFTGAGRLRKGRFELAEGGTLFLDEIGDIPPQIQVKLLRVLQEREFERLGGSHPIKANIRLIAATNRNLEEAIEKGEFREDLYYRLNVFSIFLPPLRERRSDILLLAEHFVEKYEREHGKRIRRISTPAIDMLMSYHFPGNVRELENAIERAVLVCDSNVIHGHHLPPTLQTAEVSGTATDLSLTAAVESFEQNLIIDTLKSSGGNIAKTARTLDSTERILGYKIRKYGIDATRFKRSI